MPLTKRGACRRRLRAPFLPGCNNRYEPRIHSGEDWDPRVTHQHPEAMHISLADEQPKNSRNIVCGWSGQNRRIFCRSILRDYNLPTGRSYPTLPRNACHHLPRWCIGAHKEPPCFIHSSRRFIAVLSSSGPEPSSWESDRGAGFIFPITGGVASLHGVSVILLGDCAKWRFFGARE